MAHVRIHKLDMNRSTVYSYNIFNMETVSYNLNTPVSPLPLPEEGADENILVKVEGNSATISLTYKIKDETARYNKGNELPENQRIMYGGKFDEFDLITIFQQWNAIQHDFVGTSIDDAYRFEFVDEGGNTLVEWEGFIVDFAVRTTGDSPVTLTASFDFIEGNVITTYEQDGASPPLNVSVTPSSAGTVNVFWSRPTNTGTGNPSISGYNVQSMEPGDVWRSHSVSGGNSISTTISGLASGLTHSFRVAAVTGSQQVGAYSPAVDLEVP